LGSNVKSHFSATFTAGTVIQVVDIKRTRNGW
jgi:hypothetical protein